MEPVKHIQSDAESADPGGIQTQTAAAATREPLPDNLPANFDPLALSNQLCFPLYATSRAITKHYTPLLKKLDLTYTQYLVMMVLWECQQTTVHDLGDALYLDSGTLTPLLKKMEAKGLLTRQRDTADERKVIVTITEKGQQLREQALSIPGTMWQCVNIPAQDAAELRRLLAEVMGNLNTKDN
jgi:DNA-binding MarR family transcriptional regulator